MQLSLIQSATHWHDPAANRQRFDKWLDAVPTTSQLVVLPEMFSTGFTMASREQAEPVDGPTIAWLQQRARERQQVLCGSVVVEVATGDYRNRMVWAPPSGPLQYYDKRHRFRMAGEHEHYTAGERRVVVMLGTTRILLQVCYDLRFPVFSRNCNDYDVYLLVANWPAARAQHWHTLLAARAIENQCYAVGVNCLGTDGNGVAYNGGSSVIDFQGRPVLVAESEPGVFSTALDLAALHSYRRDFPAWQDADAFALSDNGLE